MTEELDFESVGRFTVKIPSPDAPGLYRYEPYRSLPHYKLRERLREGEVVSCRLAAADGTVVRFIVTGHHEYGVLKIAFASG